MIFISRVYENLDYVNSIHLTVRLFGCNERQLASFEDFLVHLDDWYKSKDDAITWEKDIQIIELRANHKEIARHIAIHIFHVFNWNDVDEKMIEDWQDKLISRRP